jgi:hypothetical protein
LILVGRYFRGVMTDVFCGRVGCGESAVAALLMSPQDTQAWIVAPDHPSAPEGVPLCTTHADRISVPFGWTLADDRPPPKKRRRKKKAPDTPPELELFVEQSEAMPADVAALDPEPAETDPDERTPLLQRAFRVVRDD